MTTKLVFLTMSAALTLSCGSTEPLAGTPGGTSGATANGGTSSAGGSSSSVAGGSSVGGASAVGDSAGGKNSEPMVPDAPVLVEASLVTHGMISLAWENPASTCSVVEINRNTDGGDYSVAQTLTGLATSAEDMPGHTNGTYCYTITCTLDGLDSEPSNEKCVTQ